MGTAFALLETPVGRLGLVEEDGVLRCAAFVQDEGELFERAGCAATAGRSRSGELAGIVEAVEAYFAGSLDALDRIQVSQPGTPFQRHVWDVLRGVRAGTTVSYAQLAAESGRSRAIRAVASTCARNRVALAVPCHRVVASGGGLGGYAYGFAAKAWLLDHEASACTAATRT